MQNSNVTECLSWFGDSWGAGICRDAPRVDVPAGAVCACGEHIGENDMGLMIPRLENVRMEPFDPKDGSWRLSIVARRPYHLECALALIVGPSLDG